MAKNKKCFQSFLDEFQLSKFSLFHDKPADFCRSQWQRGERSWIWLIYRWSLAAFFVGGFLSSVIETFNYGKWFIYFTDWGYTLSTYTSVFGAVIATIYFKRPDYFEPGSVSLKIYWASHYASSVLAMVITLMYWAAIHPSLDDAPVDFYNILEHALNGGLMLFDMFMVAFPFRLLHFIYPIIEIIIYGLFSVIYYWSGGKDIFGNHFIYFILDWERPGLAIGSLFGVIVLALIFCILVFWIYRFRLWMFRRCVKSERTARNA